MSLFLLMVLASGGLHLFSRDFGGSWTGASAISNQIERGRALYEQHGCADCHGQNGDEPILNEYPKIRGQNARYTLQQLVDMKTGKRSNGMSALMRAKLLEINEEELRAISAFLESK